jgi:adenylate cyclase
VFVLQAEVARAIAAEIEGVLASNSNRRPEQPPVDTAALRQYMRGLRLFEAGGPARTAERESTWALLDSASVAFERATELDPTFALAWAYLASSRHWRASAAPQALADSLYPRALDAADRAIGLDPNEWLAWAARGWALTRTWKFDEARIAYDRAADLNQNGVQWYLGHFYVAVGELPDAAEAFYQNWLRDPNWPQRRYQAAFYMACAGDYDGALDIADPALLSPLGAEARSARAGIYFRQGRFQDAVQEFEAQLRSGETPPNLMPYAYLKAGNLERASELVRVRQSAGLSDLEDDLVLGDTERLVDRLRAAADSRDQSLLWLKCREVYPELLDIQEVRAIIDALDLPGT